MAIYHLSVKPISRADGRSATAAAAYRAGELVQDHTSGEAFDYTRRRGVEHTEIVLPSEAAKRDINWARDREALWNAAEAAENRSNSRVAREYELALPHELNHEQRVALVQKFSQTLADRYGVAVDIAIHQPHRHGDGRNHHAHLLTTTRVIEAGGLGEKSAMEWSDTNRRKAELGPTKAEISTVRGLWETLTNEHLQAQGVAARIDRRSLEAQGIERQPQSHLGPAVNGMERRGIQTEVGKRLEAEGLAFAQQRLDKAAAAGRLERESRIVQRSILDLSGDLESAKRERDLLLLRRKQLAEQPRDLDQVRSHAREQWAAMRAEQPAKDKDQTPEQTTASERQETRLNLDEQRRDARERWQEFRQAPERGGPEQVGPPQPKRTPEGPERDVRSTPQRDGPEIE